MVSSVDRVFYNPRYDSSNFDNDIGLLRLSEPVDFTDVIRPICLPSPDVETDAFRVCVSTGFGRTSWEGISIIHCDCSVVIVTRRPTCVPV